MRLTEEEPIKVLEIEPTEEKSTESPDMELPEEEQSKLLEFFPVRFHQNLQSLLLHKSPALIVPFL